MATPAPLTIEQQMAANSAAWKTAAPAQQALLHQQNLELAKQTGQSYNSGTGTYTPAPPQATRKPMVGPIQPGATRPSVDVPNPALSPAPPTAPQNGTLQGPYPVKDANGQTTYQAGMNVVNGAMAPNPPTPQGGMTSAPPGSGGNGLYQDQYARTPDQIAKLAKERIDKILQAGRTSAAGSLAGAKNAYDYTNAIEKDTRTLEDASFAESNNPFSGKYQYDKTNVSRYRGIEDTGQDNNYNAQVGLINQKLADLEAAAPGDEAAIIDELQQIERQTGINVAQLQEQQKQNQFNQGMQNKQFNQNQQVIDYNQNPNNPQNQGQILNNQLAQYQLDAYPEQAKNAAKLVEQQLKSGQISLDTANYNYKQLTDKNSPINQAADIDLQLKKLDLKNAPEEARLKLQQLTKQIAQIGAAPYQSANDKAMDEVRLEIAREQLKELKDPKKDSAAMSSELEGLYTGISTGQISAYDANAEISARVKAGLTTTEEAAQMKAFIQKIAESNSSHEGQDGPKMQTTNNDKLSTMTNPELEKAWETDPTGKKSGRAMYDWMRWIHDTTNGYKAGTSYELWKSKYGPTLG